VPAHLATRGLVDGSFTSGKLPRRLGFLLVRTRPNEDTGTPLKRLTRWIERGDNPSAVAYGTLAIGLLIAAEDPAVETYPKLVEGTIVAIVLYWFAHSYAHILGQRFTTRRPISGHDIVNSFTRESALVWGATTPLLALLASWLIGAKLETAVTAALWTAALTLFIFEVIAGIRAGLSHMALAGNAIIGAGLGAALFAIKIILH
jgi:hypothetical protein